MIELTVEAFRQLHKGGWSPGRCVPIDEAVRGIEKWGFHVDRKAAQFLRSFLGIKVRCPPRVLGGVRRFSVDPLKAACAIMPWQVKEYERLLKMPLTPVGVDLQGEMDILMVSDGRVVAGFENTLLLVGVDGHDAINAVCDGRRMPMLSPKND